MYFCISSVVYLHIKLLLLLYPNWPLTLHGVVGTSMSGKPLLLPEVFSGESLSAWAEHFESVATVNKWDSDDDKRKWLKVRLTGKAWTAFQKLPADVRNKYGECVKALKQRFEPDSKKAVVRGRTSHQGET